MFRVSLGAGAVGFCTIETSYDGASGKATDAIGGAVHGVRVTLDEALDGRVRHANGEPIGNHIGGDGETWSNISIKKGGQGNPEDDVSANDMRSIDTRSRSSGPLSAAGYSETAFLAKRGPFKIPEHLRGKGRGRTGAGSHSRSAALRSSAWAERVPTCWILWRKRPSRKSTFSTADAMDWHNLMRAPGAPTCEEIESLRKAHPLKVDYYHAKYASLRQGVHAHGFGVDNSAMFAEFMSAHPVDFAFVCIDQRKECDSPRQDEVYTALSEAGVPFIDSGVSITLENRQVGGAVTTERLLTRVR